MFHILMEAQSLPVEETPGAQHRIASASTTLGSKPDSYQDRSSMEAVAASSHRGSRHVNECVLCALDGLPLASVAAV